MRVCEKVTFLDSQVPKGALRSDRSVCNTFNISKRNSEYFEGHRINSLGQFTEQFTELGKEWEEIAGMAFITSRANLKDLDTWDRSRQKSVFDDNTSGARSILVKG